LLFFKIPKKSGQETIVFTKDLFEKVISAVLCSFNPNTTNNDKHNAFKFLEDLKENYTLICLTISFELLKQINNQPILHHYGLHLMESIIKYKWTILKNDERNFVKEQLFLIIKSQYLHQLFNDPIYIRNSLAKCAVELIKRDCFEKVNTTLDEFVNMIQGINQIQGLFFFAVFAKQVRQISKIQKK
jgi:hypothetical protein